MKVSRTEGHNATVTGKRIGTAAGFAAYTANVIHKEGKDIFKKSIEMATEKGYGKNVGVAIKVGSIGLIAGGVAVAGRIVGGLIGKVIDNMNMKKQQKAFLNSQKLIGAASMDEVKDAADPMSPKGCVA